ncbi:hypothetical protein [Sorangium sp. So ce1389]|uniref:hypothetical protein n=1 Tax=Sorangium sp. So ce1389 TaxID=3133336 RepID=UPI003F60542B
MISIHGKVMGLAMVVAALGTGCAVDAADADFDQAGLDEVDSTAAALEEGAEEERGGYQAQAPTKDMFAPSKGVPSKGMLGQAPVGQLGQEPVGQLGQEPVGQLGQAPIGAPGQSARFFGGVPGGFCGGFPGFGGGFGGGFGSGFGSPFNINNNNNINVISILEELLNRHNVCPKPVVIERHEHHGHHGHHGPCHGPSGSGPLGWGNWP